MLQMFSQFFVHIFALYNFFGKNLRKKRRKFSMDPIWTNPQKIIAESVMIELGSTFTECSKSRHLRSVEKD